MRSLTAVTALIVLVTASPSLAQECAAMLDELEARMQGQALTGSTGSSGNLAQSDGVIEPPPVGNTPTYSPPEATGSAMQTAPEITPQTNSGSPAPSATAEAAESAQVEALVTAARQAAQRGDEVACRERLDEALGLVDPAGR